MRRRMFLQKAAAVAAAPIVLSEPALSLPALSKGRVEWKMITMFRVSEVQQRFAQIMAEASDGQLIIEPYSRGKIPPTEVIDDMRNGKIEMGWGNFIVSPSEVEGSPQKRIVPAADFLIMPFGLTAREFSGWIEYGGGLQIVDKIYKQIGCKYFPAGNTEMQMGGWYAKEINTIEDLKGLKIRISGFGAEVMRALGAEPYDVAPWSDDAQSALTDGKLDAFELGTPVSDMAAGLHRLDKFRFYYYPAWHEPSVPFALSINREKWNALPSHLQVIISTAARWLDYQRLIDRTAPNGTALASLVQEHSVQVKQFPDSVLKVLAGVSDQILRERASQDELSQEIFNSLMQFRQKAITWSMASHQPFLTARGSTS